ncbi:MAG: MFS transporter [Nocardiopsaceae bacterium]|jgi:MFS family permease|nr:MFS transporter [Nocardiopsaceae bacterium]
MSAPVRDAPNSAARPRSSFIGDLRTVLGSGGFRKLFATRLISQTGDGVFSAGLGAYVFFNSTTFHDPGYAVRSFALLYLPYSLIGPFAGVFIDRWSRRQIMLWSALLRAAFAALTAVFIAFGALKWPVWIAALVVLGVNRFFLSSLSAALPHVVSDDELVMANAVSPTSGTVVAFIGGIIALGVRLLTGTGAVGSAVILLGAAFFYLAAGLSATRMERNSLGPDLRPGDAPASVAHELGAVAVGLVAGLRHVWSRRSARSGLVAVAAHRFVYGILLLMSILLYRNYFYPGSDSNEALRNFLPVVISSAIGYGAAAWLTPVVTKRIPSSAWIVALLGAGGLVTLIGLPFGQLEFIAIGFALGVVAQGIVICVITTLQQQMEDDYRGRVFSVYDMLFNVTFVLGAAFGAAFMPFTGRSVPMLLVVACGYVVAAVVYWLMMVQWRGAGSKRPGSAPAGPAQVGSAQAVSPDAPGSAPGYGDQSLGSPESRAQRSSS